MFSPGGIGRPVLPTVSTTSLPLPCALTRIRPPAAIVFSRVLQEILHNERRVAFFARYEKAGRKFLFDLHIGRIRERAKIVQPFINELAKIYWCRQRFEDARHPCATIKANRRLRRSNDAFDEEGRTALRKFPA